MLYFFDTAVGDSLFRDESGTELESDERARDEASALIAELAKEHIPGDGSQKNIALWVRNVDGETIMVLTLSFALSALGPRGMPTALDGARREP